MPDFKKFRKENGLTQGDVATWFGCTQGFISQIEKGLRPVPAEFVLKAQADGLWDVSELIDVNLNSEDISRMENEGVNIFSSGKVIPYFDAEVAAGNSYCMEMVPSRTSGMIEIGGLMKDSEFALRVYGNSMTPYYPAGCVIGLKRHTDSFIEPGTVYVVETAENRYLKRLYYNCDKSAFRCISDNTMRHESGPMTSEFFYQEFEIPLCDVCRLLRVTGVIKRNIL